MMLGEINEICELLKDLLSRLRDEHPYDDCKDNWCETCSLEKRTQDFLEKQGIV